MSGLLRGVAVAVIVLGCGSCASQDQMGELQGEIVELRAALEETKQALAAVSERLDAAERDQREARERFEAVAREATRELDGRVGVIEADLDIFEERLDGLDGAVDLLETGPEPAPPPRRRGLFR